MKMEYFSRLQHPITAGSTYFISTYTKMSSKTAIVTGGASGIGLAIAETFIEAGFRTIIIGRDLQKLDKAKKQFGANCQIVPFDLNQLDKIPALVASLERDNGPIDILVNNAGINLKK